MGQPTVFFEDSLYQKAWERLAKTTTEAAGVDGVRIDHISSPEEFVKEIQEKILANAYHPSPVKMIELKKGHKVRTIGILTLEDRFVHMLVKCWLEPLCLPRFHPRSFAYQPGKSASLAIEQLEQWIAQGYEWIGETDIRSFFDEIDHRILAQQLRYFTKDEEKISFILYLYRGQERGIVQGSPLSPLLANVYLHLFDEYMSANGQPYLRFSDDLVILDESKERVEHRLQKMEQFLLTLGLSIHPEKTAVKHLSETFEFLGFRFDEEGRKVAVKGVESLREKMNGVKQYPAVEREERYEMILRGWMQYYESIPWETFDEPEWLLFVADFETDRDKISDAYTKATSRLSRKEITPWHAQRLYRLASLLELRKDQLYWLTSLHTLGVPLSTEDEQQLYTVYQLTKTDWLSLVTYLERCVSEQGDEAYDDLINYFMEKRWFALAQWFHDPTPPLSQEREWDKNPEDPDIVQEDTFSKFLHLFSGKEDGFLLEVPEQGKRAFLDIRRPLIADDVRKHYVGEITIVQYIIRSNKTVSYAVIDVDIPKHVLHQIGHEGEAFAAKRHEALQDALRLRETAQKKGFPSYLVDSGFRGYHVWFFFSEPIMLKSAYEFLVKLTAEAGTPSDGLTWELFPKQRKLKEGAKGQRIKLPWGKHSMTGRQAWFVDDGGEPLVDQLGIVDRIIPIEKQAVIQFVEGRASSSERLPVQPLTPSPSVLAVVQGCPIASHMVEKAKQTNYLTHQERLFLLNVFAPMGEDGKKFIHHVISHTFNYNFHTTEKFVRRSYDKPISCLRIREHFPSLTAQLGCHCQFRLAKGMYPTPVLHSPRFRTAKQSERKDDATILAEMGATKEEMTKEQIRSDRFKHVNELVNKMIQLRKHQRGIQSKLRSIEEELRQLFTELGIERLEIDQGYLVWKREGNSDRWVIEL